MTTQDPPQGDDVVRPQPTSQPYAEAAWDYLSAGWDSVLPIGYIPGNPRVWAPRRKDAPPVDRTGAADPPTSGPDVAAWIETVPELNIGLRMPGRPDLAVLGIDVDAYGGKPGAESLAALEAELGPLPPTWVSSSRGYPEEPSGIRFYRVPPGLGWPGELAKGIETVRCGHRYAVVWPSMHPEGRIYFWTDPSGELADGVPVPAELGWLPIRWVARFAGTSAGVTAKARLEGSAADWLAERSDPRLATCPVVAQIAGVAEEELRTPGVTRHEVMLRATAALAHRAAEGHHGVARALEGLRAVWAQVMAAEPGERDTEAEWRRAVLGAVEAAAAEHPEPAPWDPCTEPGAGIIPPEAIPADRERREERRRAREEHPRAEGGNPDGPGVHVSEPAGLPAAGVAVSDAEMAGAGYLADADRWNHGQIRFAHRMVAQHGADLRHCKALGWFTWSGHHWETDLRQRHLRLVYDVRAAAYAQAGQMEAPDRAALMADLRRIETEPAIRGVAAAVGIYPGVAVSPHDLDADPWLLNTPEGTVDLRDGSVRPNAREDLITMCTRVGIGGNGAHLWEAFLERILPDPEVRSYVQRLLGSALLGEVREHVLPIWTGTGANGKGTLRSAVLYALGDYGLEVDPALLIQTRHARHATYLMDLRGKRLVFTSETDRESPLAEATMKRLTGGDPIQANRMHKDAFTFEPSHQLIMLTNHLPQVSGDDAAVWRRLHVVPFSVDLPPSEWDTGLSAKLRAEAPAIMRWIHAGWLDYRARGGLDEPAAVTERTDAYRLSQDALGRFLAERCDTDPSKGLRTPPREIHAAYVRWHQIDGNGTQMLSETAFGTALGNRKFTKVTIRGRTFWRDLGLIPEAVADDMRTRYEGGLGL